MGQVLETTGINHPSQADWAKSWYTSPNAYQHNLLRERYRNLGETALGEIVDATSLAVLRMENMRQMYETLTIGALASTVPDFSFTEYKELAGQPDKVIDFIGWFARQAGQFYENRDGELNGVDSSVRRAYKGVSKIGLELGGVCQAGDWENTSRLDDMIRTIPMKAENNSDIIVDVLEAPEEQRVAFRYEPLLGKFGQIRRRRAVANAKVGNGTELLLFKESLGLLVTNLAEPSHRDIILSDPQAAHNIFLPIVEEKAGKSQETKGVNNTAAALVAGEYFEHAIKERNTNRMVIPLGAHYVMLACLGNQANQIAV